MTEKIVIVGQGYVGLPIAMRAIEAGFSVTGIDIEKKRVDSILSGVSYVEDVTSEQLASAFRSGRYHITSSVNEYSGFNSVIITVPTPLKEGLPDLTFIEECAKAVAPYVSKGSLIVLESTTYPGTTENLLVPILDEGSGLHAGTDYHVGYSPERIDPGNKTYNFRNTPKVISGLTPSCLERVRSLYCRLVDQVVDVRSPREAELTKLLENTFRHVNIALINELAVFARDLGIDVWEAIDAASTKPFGYMRFTPGPGVGGHCLPVDPSYLSWEVKRTLGHNFRFVELANDVNDHMPDYVVRRLILGLNERRRSVSGSRVTLLGLAYKKNTGDARESPALRVAELLVEMGAEVTACDPYVEQYQLPASITLAPFDQQVISTSDAVLILTDHDSFRYDLIEGFSGYVLDTRRRLHGVVESL